MDWQTITNIILAAIAVTTLIASIATNSRTNRKSDEIHAFNKSIQEHNTKIQQTNLNLALMEKRYEVYSYFIDKLFKRELVSKDLTIVEDKIDFFFEGDIKDKLKEFISATSKCVEGNKITLNDYSNEFQHLHSMPADETRKIRAFEAKIMEMINIMRPALIVSSTIHYMELQTGVGVQVSKKMKHKKA
jgi:hypothetical protein